MRNCLSCFIVINFYVYGQIYVIILYVVVLGAKLCLLSEALVVQIFQNITPLLLFSYKKKRRATQLLAFYIFHCFSAVALAKCVNFLWKLCPEYDWINTESDNTKNNIWKKTELFYNYMKKIQKLSKNMLKSPTFFQKRVRDLY